MTYDEAIEKLKRADRLIITVSGDIGAGKSTFAKRLAQELEIPRIYIGQFIREEAAKRKITLDELNKLQETDDTLDRYFDEMLRERSTQVKKGVFEGRTAWHFVENPTVKIFLSVDPNVATDRIWTDRSDKRDQYGTKEALRVANEERKASEIKRYQNYYGIDAYDHANFDIVVDTSNLDLDEVYQKTVIKIAKNV
ncbi:AAA family ATPase [Candidatus Uhrbacteria bacterium]|jgi:CMP/dCMP kinase|nr:AAA family ATPase [Candidatus Uhrbacteria bacterium]MBT7716853.1 AAA family ATPase [Candidatus Uhrbacteria bacterium]